MGVPCGLTPIGTDDSYATSPDTPLSVAAASGVLVNDSDVDLDSLQAILVDDATSGTLTLNLDGSFSYTPNIGFIGSDTFTYVANDGSGNSNIATVTITITNETQGPPTFTVGDATAVEGGAGGSSVDFVVELSRASSETVSVEFRTADGTSRNSLATCHGKRSFLSAQVGDNHSAQRKNPQWI